MRLCDICNRNPYKQKKKMSKDLNTLINLVQWINTDLSLKLFENATWFQNT